MDCFDECIEIAHRGNARLGWMRMFGALFVRDVGEYICMSFRCCGYCLNYSESPLQTSRQ